MAPRGKICRDVWPVKKTLLEKKEKMTTGGKDILSELSFIVKFHAHYDLQISCKP
jgi:hypothetical protein